MSGNCYIAYNAITSALNAPLAGVNTPASIGTKMTMLQVKTGAVGTVKVKEWGYSFLTIPTQPVQMELLEADVFATVTTGEVLKYSNATGNASQTAVPGTASTGFTSTAEGTIAASRLLDQKFDLGPYMDKIFIPGNEPEVGAGKSLRIRATPNAAVAIPVVCYIVWEE